MKRDYFPYFTQDKDITVDTVQLHVVQDRQVNTALPRDLDLAGLTTALKNDGAFDLVLNDEALKLVFKGDAVLVRQPQVEMFVLIKYSIRELSPRV